MRRRCSKVFPQLMALGVVTLMIALPVATARAQLKPEEVLVVYDSRILDCRPVAEYYAGSAKVPGGAGGMAGIHPGVNAVNLATLGVPALAMGDTTYAEFVARLRDPLRAHLTATGLTTNVRSIVLCKGLPHRIQDTDNAAVGDNPPLAETEFLAGDYNCASVDSELTLLWQNLNAGEAGGGGDSKADGIILNPYARATLPITAFTSANIMVAKAFSQVESPAGLIWSGATGAGAAQLTPGDMYLVCRLDGRSVLDVRAMIDRAQTLVVNPDTAVFVLDESNSNAVADAAETDELDNQGPPELRLGDDYEQTRDLLIADRRYLAANIRYNALGGNANFLVGPRIEFDGLGIVIRGPVLLLATEGANHSIIQNTPPTPMMGSQYPRSFKYARGAVFNSIESANGRDFGGIGPNFGQAQAADFLAAGGTFAVANVWEPFTWTIPDNLPIARSFFLGGLSWAEAAYAALPALSFHQIVLGDPLARVIRTSEDINGDGTLNVDDLYAWQATPRDLNHDGIANAVDRLILETAVRGSENTFMQGPQR